MSNKRNNSGISLKQLVNTLNSGNKRTGEKKFW
jgi:hypothetical protein